MPAYGSLSAAEYLIHIPNRKIIPSLQIRFSRFAVTTMNFPEGFSTGHQMPLLHNGNLRDRSSHGLSIAFQTQTSN